MLSIYQFLDTMLNALQMFLFNPCIPTVEVLLRDPFYRGGNGDFKLINDLLKDP